MGQCGAHIVISPESTLEERRCTKPAGLWTFAAHDGFRPLCEPHAKSYREVGFVLILTDELFCRRTVANAIWPPPTGELGLALQEWMVTGLDPKGLISKGYIEKATQWIELKRRRA
jgi:hypothetical protein